MTPAPVGHTDQKGVSLAADLSDRYFGSCLGKFLKIGAVEDNTHMVLNKHFVTFAYFQNTDG